MYSVNPAQNTRQTHWANARAFSSRIKQY